MAKCSMYECRHTAVFAGHCGPHHHWIAERWRAIASAAFGHHAAELARGGKPDCELCQAIRMLGDRPLVD